MTAHALSPETSSIAAGLLRARRTGTGLAKGAVPVPLDVANAMRVQSIVQEQWARPVGGWKVAIGPQARAIAAPLLDVQADGARIELYPHCSIEVELAFRLARDLPRRSGRVYDRASVLDAIEEVVVGIEVIGGRFGDPTDVPFLSFLADNLGNRAYVVGDGLPVSTLDQMDDLVCDVKLEGASLHRAPAIHPAQDPLIPLLAYANDQTDTLGGLKAGQTVTTGSLCGVLPVTSPGRLEARLGPSAMVAMRFLA